MIYMETIRGYPYKKQQDIASEFGIGRTTVYERLKEIEKEISNGRYSDYAIIRDGNIVLVNVLVFLDYMKYRDRLREKNTRKYAPPFNPTELMETCGWQSKIVRET